MFIEETITVWIEGLQALLSETGDFPFAKMKGMAVRTDYPMREDDYPCLWVGLLPQGDVQNVGIGHVEHVEGEDGVHRVYRWRFSASVEITVACFGALERARYVDWLAKAIGFGHSDEPGPMGVLRSYVEGNDLVGMIVSWESFVVSGFADTPGTPWGTEEVIYEGTITMTVEGEVVYDPSNAALVPLASILVEERFDSEPVPSTPDADGWM